jgi:hypothetical protein
MKTVLKVCVTIAVLGVAWLGLWALEEVANMPNTAALIGAFIAAFLIASLAFWVVKQIWKKETETLKCKLREWQ